ncbi:hypothetical protein GWK47_006485 [Chionoecetes opilio]|uniref:Uncharacterized protein n=1 Tax=Chionoecetes opilio TaxID=41210 RepID=A0A8J5CX14_CHIOP|nr:hypothetical protein GWK47_006485 [Chionoecetes opilio]
MACGEEGDDDWHSSPSLWPHRWYCGKSRQNACAPAMYSPAGQGRQWWPSLVRSSLTRSRNVSSLTDAVLVASRQFTEMLNRGKLDQALLLLLNIVREICFMFEGSHCLSHRAVSTEILKPRQADKPSDFCGVKAVLVASRQSRRYSKPAAKLTKPPDFCNALLVRIEAYHGDTQQRQADQALNFCLNVVREICFMCD